MAGKYVVEAGITAENLFTSPLCFGGKPGNLSISGTWTATVYLQRSFDGGNTWKDVDSYTANVETVVDDPEETVLYRVGVKTGGFTSGTVTLRLSR